MTDEEKKAIEKFKNLGIKVFREQKVKNEEKLSYIEYVILLNLIEKQQKEIEYLKGIAKKFNEGTNLNDTEMDYVIKIYEKKKQQ